MRGTFSYIYNFDLRVAVSELRVEIALAIGGQVDFRFSSFRSRHVKEADPLWNESFVRARRALDSLLCSLIKIKIMIMIISFTNRGPNMVLCVFPVSLEQGEDRFCLCLWVLATTDATSAANTSARSWPWNVTRSSSTFSHWTAQFATSATKCSGR